MFFLEFSRNRIATCGIGKDGNGDSKRLECFIDGRCIPVFVFCSTTNCERGQIFLDTKAAFRGDSYKIG